MLYATIMAGGSGTRFWPASRRARPKQLLQLFNDSSMLQASVSRLQGLVEPSKVLVLTNEVLVEATRQQLPAIPQSSIIGEPCKRDTAPCVALAAALIDRIDPNATMLVTPADHEIQRTDLFHQAVREGQALIDSSPTRFVTFGIVPDYPAQVFGYIERGEAISGNAWKVARFREKPDETAARAFVESGRFFWNAGIFMWRCRAILDAIGEYEPGIMQHIRRIADSHGTSRFAQTFASEFAAIRGKSIDYAVMEHYPDVCVIEAPFDWDDVGNWTALRRLVPQDENRNAAVGNHLLIDSRGCIVHGHGDHLIVTLGLEDCVVVHTPDATLVTTISSEGTIKRVVEELESRKLDQFL
jgi:mannose-1-phosphate guanylyltransferase